MKEKISKIKSVIRRDGLLVFNKTFNYIKAQTGHILNVGYKINFI